jgi:hypothetical protein
MKREGKTPVCGKLHLVILRAVQVAAQIVFIAKEGISEFSF